MLQDFYSITGRIPEKAFRPRYNLAPTQQAIALRLSPQTGGRELVSLRWGLVPRWSKPDLVNQGQINARSDGVATKPSFRDAFKQRRCVIPATGFYEWKTLGKKKQPYFVYREDGVPLSFAGLWEHWKLAGHEPMTTFAIITTDPNEFIAPLHHRMGVVLEPEAVAAWLDSSTPTETLPELLASRPWSGVCYRAVNPIVNSVRNDVPACIQPAESDDDNDEE